MLATHRKRAVSSPGPKRRQFEGLADRLAEFERDRIPLTASQEQRNSMKDVFLCGAAAWHSMVIELDQVAGHDPAEAARLLFSQQAKLIEEFKALGVYVEAKLVTDAR